MIYGLGRLRRSDWFFFSLFLLPGTRFRPGGSLPGQKKKTKRNEKQTVNIRLKERENKTEMGPYIIDDQREMMEEASYRHRTRTWNAGAEKQLRTEFFFAFLPSLASMMHELGDIAFSAPIEMSIDRERERERMRFGWPPKRFHQQRDE